MISSEAELAAAFPFVLVGMEQNVVHGQNSLRNALVIGDDRQFAHLVVRHDAERFVILVFRLARGRRESWPPVLH